ncbi:MAG: hypothetical protein ACRCT2_09605, partial [Plesiomonas shigelloides]
LLFYSRLGRLMIGSNKATSNPEDAVLEVTKGFTRTTPKDTEDSQESCWLITPGDIRGVTQLTLEDIHPGVTHSYCWFS